MITHGLKASLVAQMVRSVPAVQETWVWSLGQEDPLEKEMATHCNILAWKIPWTEEPGRLQSTGSRRVRRDWAQHSTRYRSSLLFICKLNLESHFYTVFPVFRISLPLGLSLFLILLYFMFDWNSVSLPGSWFSVLPSWLKYKSKKGNVGF